MPQIGPLEILVVAVLALITLGPEKLPGVARKVGQGITQLKTMANQAKSEFQGAMDDFPMDNLDGSDDGADESDATANDNVDWSNAARSGAS